MTLKELEPQLLALNSAEKARAIQILAQCVGAGFVAIALSGVGWASPTMQSYAGIGRVL